MVKKISAAQHVTKDVIFSCLGGTLEFLLSSYPNDR